MSQYTFSFINSEYERIPYQLKKDLDTILTDSSADPKTKELVAQVCDAVEKAIYEIAHYAQDQLHL